MDERLVFVVYIIPSVLLWNIILQSLNFFFNLHVRDSTYMGIEDAMSDNIYICVRFHYNIPANLRLWDPSVDSMFYHHLLRWPTIKTACFR